MTGLAFAVVDIQPEPYAAAPQLTARLRLTEATGTAIHAIALRCQVRILPQRRGYAEEEEAGLLDLFGGRGRWPNTLKSFLWMQCSTMVQGFTGSTEVDLPLPCTFDFDVAAAKYLQCPPGRRDPAGVPVLRHGLHQGPDRIRRGAGALGPRGFLPASRVAPGTG